ncbi:MAG: ATP-binding protein [Polyangiaceae bacterium]
MSQERLGVSGAELDDLDLPAVDAFLKRRAPAWLEVMSRDDVAIKVGVAAKLAPRVVPTLAGLYVFGKSPQFVFPELGVGCVAFRGRLITDEIRERLDLEGPLPSLVDGAARFVASCSGDAADEEYPLELVREVIVNALVHRDLRKPSRVAVRVFTDRVEVWSPGGPPEGAPELDDLAREGGVSHPRNPLVAAFARTLGLAEHVGRGLALLQRAATTAPSGGWRAELRVSTRDVSVILPSRWDRRDSLS